MEERDVVQVLGAVMTAEEDEVVVLGRSGGGGVDGVSYRQDLGC
jgi:hypothetical protein